MWKQLDDLDYADDIALLSHSRLQMKEKTEDLLETSKQIGLNIHKGKTKLLKVNQGSDTPLELEGTEIEEVESFTYLGSVVDKLGGTDEDRRAKAKQAKEKNEAKTK